MSYQVESSVRKKIRTVVFLYMIFWTFGLNAEVKNKKNHEEIELLDNAISVPKVENIDKDKPRNKSKIITTKEEEQDAYKDNENEKNYVDYVFTSDKENEVNKKEEIHKNDESNSFTTTVEFKQTDKEIAFENLSGHQVLCQGCIDNYISNISNALKQVLKSTGNRVDLQNTIIQSVIAEQLKKDLMDLAEKILNTDTIDEKDRAQLAELLKISDDLLIKPTIQRIHILKEKSKLSKEETEELKRLHDRISVFSRENPFQKLWKRAIEKFDDRTIGRDIRKLTLYSEYYSKFIKAPKKQYVKMKIGIEGFSSANTDHSKIGVEKYLFGNPDSRVSFRREGVIGQFEKEADDIERAKENLAKKQEIEERNREIQEEKNERIADGEIFSTGLLKKAKYHHNRYKYYYSKMESNCNYARFNPMGCKRAKSDFLRIGKGLHLKKMFDLIEMAQKDREQEVIVRTKQMREQYLADNGVEGGIDYSLHDSDEDYGEYADSFGRAGHSSFGDQFSMAPQSGRFPSGVMGMGNNGFGSMNMGMGGMGMDAGMGGNLGFTPGF